MELKNYKVIMKPIRSFRFWLSFIWQGVAGWTYGSLIIALIYTLALGYYSMFASLEDYILLFIYGAFCALLVAFILGALCAFLIVLFCHISNKELSLTRLSSLCFSIFVSIVLIVFFYRKYALVIAFPDYPFIRSYRGMLIFIVLRMIALSFASIMAIFPLYRLFLWLKDFVLRFRRGVLVARGIYGIFIIVSLLLCGSFFSMKAKALSELKPFHPRQFKINPERQVFIFGADGFSLDVVRALISQGHLPNIKRLMQQGSYAPLKTLQPCLSPRIWSSIDTGKVPEKHGVLGFYQISIPGVATSLNPHQVMGADMGARFLSDLGLPVEIINTYYGNRRAKPFWEILSEQGAEVGVINWFYSWPAQKVNGFMLSDRFPYLLLQEPGGEERLSKKLLIYGEHPSLAVAYPVKEIYHVLEEYARNHHAEINRTIFMNKRKEISTFEKENESYLDFASLPFIYYLIEHYAPDCMALYLRQPDIIQHSYWNYWQPQFFPSISTAELDENKDIIPEIYKKVDEALGRLREITNNGAVIIFVSDHGFEAIFNASTPGSHISPPDGTFIAEGMNIKSGVKLRNPSILDLAPTILYLFNLPIARDMDGRILTELFEAQYLREHPISYIDSYGVPIGKYIHIKEKVSQEEIEKLKALGYIQ